MRDTTPCGIPRRVGSLHMFHSVLSAVDVTGQHAATQYNLATRDNMPQHSTTSTAALLFCRSWSALSVQQHSLCAAACAEKRSAQSRNCLGYCRKPTLAREQWRLMAMPWLSRARSPQCPIRSPHTHLVGHAEDVKLDDFVAELAVANLLRRDRL